MGRSSNDHRTFLYRATQEDHGRAETVWMGREGFETREKYLAFLHTLRRVHCRFGWGANEPDRLAALAQDLGPLDAAPRPVPMAPSHAWGAAYVLNGSALGASILLKSGAIDPDWPTSYLCSMRTFATCGKLAEFFAALNAAHLDREDAAHQARIVFAEIHSGANLQREGVPHGDLVRG